MVQIQFLKTDNNVLVSVSLPFGEHTCWEWISCICISWAGGSLLFLKDLF